MSNKVLFGSAAAIAAGVMISKCKHQDKRQNFVSSSQQPQHLQPEQSQQRKPDSSFQEGNWISEKAEAGKNKASGVCKDLHERAVEHGEQVQDEAATGWSRVKSGISEDVGRIREALLGKPSQPPAKGAKATEISPSIFGWSFKDAEREKAIAIGEYDSTNRDLDSAQQKLSQSKKGVFDTGDADLREKVDSLKKLLDEKKQKLDSANERYESYAKKNFNEISDGLHAEDEQNLKEGMFFKWLTGSAPSEKKDGEKKTATEEDKWATGTLGGFGENAYFFSQEQVEDQLRNNQIEPSEAQRRLDELKHIKEKGWVNYTKGQESEESIARNALKSLEGWGESAAEFAHEELEDAQRRFQKPIESRDDASRAVDNAASHVQEAKKRVENTGSSWWQTAKQQSDEEHEKAKRAFDQAVRNYDEAKEIFDNWRDETTGKFWSSADGSIRTAKRKEFLPKDSALEDSPAQDASVQEQLLEE